MEGFMRIISCTAENFASYKKLEFSFDSEGLALIQGATGSGKSTLCDLVPWVLFGKTAKGGAADEVISWNNKGITKSLITIETKPGVIYDITRIRGNKSNDLYFTDAFINQSPVRGKDLADTQKMINNL